MSDRAYIFLIIVLIALGIFSYQKALKEDGRIELLDTLLQGRDKSSNGVQDIDHTLESFDFGQRIQEFEDQLTGIDQAKLRLLDSEEDMIRSLLQANTDSYRQIMARMQLIADHLNNYNDQVEQFLVIEAPILALAREPDESVRLQQFEALHRQALEQLKSLLVGSVDELTVINKSLREMAEMLQQDFDPKSWECADLKVCLASNLNVLRSQVEMYAQRTMVQPYKRLEDMAELNKIIDHELNFFLANTKGSHQQFMDSSQFVREKIDGLLDDFKTLDKERLAQVLWDFNRLENELGKIRQNLQEHISYTGQRLKNAQELSDHIRRSLSVFQGFELPSLLDEQASLADGMNERLGQATGNALAMLQLLNDYFNMNMRILESLAAFHHIDLISFKEEIGLSTDTSVPTSLAQPVVVKSDAEEQENTQKTYLQSEEKLQRLREQSARDEEMLKTMLEVYGP